MGRWYALSFVELHDAVHRHVSGYLRFPLDWCAVSITWAVLSEVSHHGTQLLAIRSSVSPFDGLRVSGGLPQCEQTILGGGSGTGSACRPRHHNTETLCSNPDHVHLYPASATSWTAHIHRAAETIWCLARTPLALLTQYLLCLWSAV